MLHVSRLYGCEKIMRDIGHLSSSPTVVKCDNEGALALLLNQAMHSSKVKHIGHHCKEEIARDTVSYKYCSFSDNLVDCLSNALPRAALENQCLAMGLGPVL